jgi:hypothetical protein
VDRVARSRRIALPRDEFFEKIREEVEVFWHRSNGRRVVKWEGG